MLILGQLINFEPAPWSLSLPPFRLPDRLHYRHSTQAHIAH
jgi:hypothetical protein